MKVVLVLAAIIVVALAQKDNPPVVEGRWQDISCNLVVNTQNIYKQRAVLYGPFDSSSHTGTWQQVDTHWIDDPTCTNGSASFITVVAGNYRQSGDKSYVPYFWNIDYAVLRTRMQAFSKSAADYLNNLPECNFSPFVAGVEQDITEVTCPDLNLVPKSNCPVYYDIIRRTNQPIKGLWYGDPYPGEPPTFQPLCFQQYRPKYYYPYGLQYAPTD